MNHENLWLENTITRAYAWNYYEGKRKCVLNPKNHFQIMTRDFHTKYSRALETITRWSIRDLRDLRRSYVESNRVNTQSNWWFCWFCRLMCRLYTVYYIPPSPNHQFDFDEKKNKLALKQWKWVEPDFFKYIFKTNSKSVITLDVFPFWWNKPSLNHQSCFTN